MEQMHSQILLNGQLTAFSLSPSWHKVRGGWSSARAYYIFLKIFHVSP